MTTPPSPATGSLRTVNRCLFLLLLLTPLCGTGASYYLDADGGLDSNEGTSPAEAWASLDRASAQSYLPGDQILLQAGYERVANVPGGLINWSRLALPFREQ